MTDLLRLRPHAFVYGRQSEANDRSIDEQLKIGQQRCDDEGWDIDVSRIYSDKVSASRHGHKARDDWPKLLKAVNDQARPGDIIWLWESSRGDRKASAWLVFLETCQERGILIYIENHGRSYDMRVPRDWKTLADEGTDNQYESDKTSLRVRRDTTLAARAGKPHGRIPYGYRREYKEDTRKGRTGLVLKAQVPDENEAPVVRFIIMSVAAGWSLRSVAADLNERGVRTRAGQEWSINTVRQVALNPAYIAKRVHDATRRPGGRPTAAAVLYDADWPPLVDGETYYTARDILTNSKRLNWRPGGAKHLLSMIAQCGVCGGPLTAAYPKATGRRPVYGCRAKRCVQIDHDDLDDYVMAMLIELLAKPVNQRRLSAAQADGGQELAGARVALAEAEAEYRDTVELFKARKISPFAFAEVEPDKIAARNAARARVTELETPPELRAVLRDPKRRVEQQLLDAPLSARRGVVRYLMRVYVDRAPAAGQFVTQGCRIPARDRTHIEWKTGTDSA